VLVLGRRICAVVEKEPSKFLKRHSVQRSLFMLVSGCRVCAVLKKKPSNFYAPHPV
jgi:hypothetical protein